ncbi:hypothetical protein HPP92_000352 [Vanilla planifolia]|uniref:PIN-like protein n=1 Tax=Vanilla planifolia TaxID=51239 RepID=A0A835S4N7_VANPL|nr:hypothetical protein HPP92_000352 [Vanilla planifolia]
MLIKEERSVELASSAMSPNDLYNVLAAVVPLYVAMLLAYASTKHFNLFTADQCSGINRFVAVFAVPLLSFEVVSRVDPFHLHSRFLAADSLSKVLLLLLLFSWSKLSKGATLDWSITLFSLASFPNTLLFGIPLLQSMYGDQAEGLMTQLVMMQSFLWYTLLLFLFEYRASRNSASVVAAMPTTTTENDLQMPQNSIKIAPEVPEEDISGQMEEGIHENVDPSNEEGKNQIFCLPKSELAVL